MTLILAIVPVLLLIVLMAFFKMPGDKSSVISLIVTILIALFGFHYAVDNLVFSFVYGFSHPDYHPDGYLQLQCIAENREDGDYQTTILFHLYR